MNSRCLVSALSVLLLAPIAAEASENLHAKDLSFVETLPPTDYIAFVGTVIELQSDLPERDSEVKFRVEHGGGKPPMRTCNLRGRFPDFSLNERYFVVCSPPRDVLAVIRIQQDDDMVDRIHAKFREETDRRILLLKAETQIVDALKVPWRECRVFDSDRPCYREFFGTRYSGRSCDVQFIYGSVLSPREPFITFDRFVFDWNAAKTGKNVQLRGTIMPGGKRFEMTAHWNVRTEMPVIDSFHCPGPADLKNRDNGETNPKK